MSAIPLLLASANPCRLNNFTEMAESVLRLEMTKTDGIYILKVAYGDRIEKVKIVKE